MNIDKNDVVEKVTLLLLVFLLYINAYIMYLTNEIKPVHAVRMVTFMAVFLVHSSGLSS